ncbi:hypothetical protein AB0E70_22535 [Streptomyces murinus]|uniref:hypothetical protein n=1 Tax=Streptomyces murinus TaxID=33900 RepID=UPI001180956A|nr:hypothetical protein [Streptomyces murinus]
MTIGMAQQEGDGPSWFHETDPLDVLFLGATFPETPADPTDFSNARDAWLRLLRGTVHGKGIERFVREAVAASVELALPVDDGRLMLALAGRLEAAGLDRRSLPRRLMPQVALQECRSLVGPDPELSLPQPPPRAKKLVKDFWRSTEEQVWALETPAAILREGLRRLQDLGLPVEEESGLLLAALYAALLTKPGEMLEDILAHACVWALSQDEGSPLVPVLDTLLVAPERGLPVNEVLGHLFSVPAFTEPIPSDALLWTSSPGLALPRMAFDLGIPEVITLGGEITPDLLDWTGMHARMRMADAARQDAEEWAGAEDDGGSDTEATHPTEEGKISDEEWDERREAVHDAVRCKLEKTGTPRRRGNSGKNEKTGRKEPAPAGYRAPDSSCERVWNADGSSETRFSSNTPAGQEVIDMVKGQLDAFREKFGREPGPDDPFFFDFDADEPTRITKEYFDSMLLEFAERAPELGIDPALFRAWREVGYVISTENRGMATVAEVLAYQRAVARHRGDGQ